MAHVKRFDEINENFFYYSDYVDLDILQGVIDGMRPSQNSTGEKFKKDLMEFNDDFPVTKQERMPATLGKQVAWWIDLYLIQDVIDRMNPILNKNAEQYKEDLKTFIS